MRDVIAAAEQWHTRSDGRGRSGKMKIYGYSTLKACTVYTGRRIVAQESTAELPFRLWSGFLSTGDSNAPGNYAILDLVAALRWIQENIRAFGGNPNEVSVLGHGFGATLVNLLMISPVTKGESCFVSFRVFLPCGRYLIDLRCFKSVTTLQFTCC